MPPITEFTTNPEMPLIAGFPSTDIPLILAIRASATMRVCDPQHSPQTRMVALADRRHANSRCSWHRRRVEEARLVTGLERAAWLLPWTLAGSCLRLLFSGMTHGPPGLFLTGCLGCEGPLISSGEGSQAASRLDQHPCHHSLADSASHRN